MPNIRRWENHRKKAWALTFGRATANAEQKESRKKQEKGVQYLEFLVMCE
jgi:hypothetical protein